MYEQQNWNDPWFLFLMSFNAPGTLFLILNMYLLWLDDPVAWIFFFLNYFFALENRIKSLGDRDKVRSTFFFFV